MSKKKNNKLKQTGVIILKGGYVKTKMDDIHKHFQEIDRGCGIIKSKKGKGSYKRKEKHFKSFKDLESVFLFH